MLAVIPQIQSAINFLMYADLISHCRSQKFELCHNFKGFTN